MSQCRCSSQTFVDYLIHNGQSVRRDCAGCGRTLCFTVWLGVDQFAEAEKMATDWQRQLIKVRHEAEAKHAAQQTQRRKYAADARRNRIDLEQD